MCVFHLKSETYPSGTNEVFGTSHLQQKPMQPFQISQWHKHLYACVAPSYFKLCWKLILLLKMNFCKVAALWVTTYLFNCSSQYEICCGLQKHDLLLHSTQPTLSQMWDVFPVSPCRHVPGVSSSSHCGVPCPSATRWIFLKSSVWQGLGTEVKHREELFTFLFFLLDLEV